MRPVPGRHVAKTDDRDNDLTADDKDNDVTASGPTALRHRRSRRSCWSRPRARSRSVSALGVSALKVSLVTLLALGPALAGDVRAAYADVVTAPYAIVAPADSVNDVMASPKTVAEGTTTNFQVKFTVTVALSGTSAGSWLRVVPSADLGSAPGQLSLLDDTGATCVQAGAGSGNPSASGFTVYLAPTCSLGVGDEVELDFSAQAPRATRSFSFTVTTSANPDPATSNPVTEVASPPTFSSSSEALGVDSTYMLGDASWTVLSTASSFNALALSASSQFGDVLTWYGSGSGYLVEVTSPAGLTSPDQVASVVLGRAQGGAQGGEVTLVLARPVQAGDSLTVLAAGTNPPTTSSDVVSLQPEGASGGWFQPVGAAETTNSVLFGTSVKALTVAVAPRTAGALATYTVGFQATTALEGGSGASICLGEAAGPTNFATATAQLVTDTSAGWHFIATATTYPSGNPPANPGCGAADNGEVIALPAGYDIRAGDLVTIVLAHVTNPPAGTVSDFALSTSSDTVAARADPYDIEESAEAGVVVDVSPPTTGALATYTVSGLVASSAVLGAHTELTLEGPAGMVFPTSPGSYIVQDLTHPSGSGVVEAAPAGGGTGTVAIVMPANIAPGDQLVLVVQDVVNPPSAGSSYTLTLLGPFSGAAFAPVFPRANVTYPNGALLNFAGTEYVMAGGHAFGVPGPAALYALERVDRAEPQTAPGGSAPPEGPLRQGTLVSTRAVNGDPTVYVAGADGELHGFASAAQLRAYGYDPALVVTVPGLSGLTVGAPVGRLGSAADALSTSADGAIVGFGGRWYVFAGGRAFPVLSSLLPELQRLDTATPLLGVVSSAQLSAAVAAGVLVSSAGVVYVSYQGKLWPFKSPSQLVADGYSGTAAVPVPYRGGLPVVGTYSGS